MTTPLAELLELIGHNDDTFTSICHQKPDDKFVSMVLPSPQAGIVAPAIEGANVWYGINPVAGPTRYADKRGTVEDVTRWTALWLDIDIKPSGCPSMDVAVQIVDVLSEVLGTRPVAVVNSGHGVQPIWAIDPDEPETMLDSTTRRQQAQVYLSRWARLARSVAAAHNSKLDSVFDLARVLRAPCTLNLKDTPVPTELFVDTGAPLSIDQLRDALDAYGITELPSDKGHTNKTVIHATWDWADTTCAYVASIPTHWRKDTPDARHPWLINQATRLAAAAIHGCISEHDYGLAIRDLTNHFTTLCANHGLNRHVGQSEVEDAIRWGQHKASTMDAAELVKNVGQHTHPAAREAEVKEERRHLSVVPAAPTEGSAALQIDVQPDPETRVFSRRPATFTDHGNGDLFAHQHHTQLRYNPDRGKWLAWDGTRWAWQADNSTALRLAMETIENIPQEGDDEKHRTKSLSLRALEATVKLGRTDPRVTTSYDNLDAQPHHLNTPNGIIDLRDGSLTPHDPLGPMHTKQTRAAYNPTATCPRWHEFLEDTFGDDEALIDFIQRLAGYSATGVVTAHVLPFLHGAGGNGKSVFLNVLVALLGDYATTASGSFLMAGKDEHKTEIARLAGMRMVICSEVNQNAKFDEAKVKLLTGGDKLTARFMHKDFFEFDPTHKLWLMGNHQPNVDAGGESFWRRLRMVPFTKIVPDEKKDGYLTEKLIEREGEGILAWIVQGAVKMLHDGLKAPAAVTAATHDYANEEDALGLFLEDCCHVGGGEHIKVNTAALRKAYSKWCREQGITELNSTAFGRQIKTRANVGITRSNGVRFYTGICLLATEEDEHWAN